MGVKTQLEPPDGGWGICVCIGMALPFISALSALPSFGLLFADFLNEIGAETSAMAFITSFFFCALSFTGLFSGSLFNRYGLRPIGLCGGFLYFGGSVAQIFVNSTWTLTIAFSLLQGSGFGLMVPTCYTTFNNYFVKKRIMWMSFAQTLIGVGSMLYPLLVQKLLELFGFRGCLLVLAALNSHAVLGMLLMQPVEWHMRKVEIDDPEELAVVGVVATSPIQIVLSQETVITPIKESNVDKNDEAEQDEDERVEAENEAGNQISPLMHESRRHSKFSKEDFRVLSRRSSSILSLGNWSGPIVVSDASPEMTMRSRTHSMPASASLKDRSSNTNALETKLSLWQKIVEFLDLTLLKDVVYVNIVLGISFALYSDIAFFTLQPMYLFEIGFSKPGTASIIAIGAAADLFSRIFLAFSAIFLEIPSRYIYLAGAFFATISRYAFLQIDDFMGMACITAVMGFLRTWVHVPLPLVFAEFLPKERFATGYGLFMFMQGNILFIIGPIVGFLRDTTKNYILTFHVITLFMALCVVPWIIEIVCIKFRRKKKLGTSL